MPVNKFQRILLVGAWLISSHGAAMAAASGVIRLELPDAAAVGKGSAFVGEANRPSAIYYNPAGIVQLGPQVSLGFTVLRPALDYKPATGDMVQMRSNSYLFPHIYFTTPLIENKLYIGVGENSNWGAGNEWAADSPSGFTRYSMLKDEFENKDYMIVGAYKFNEQLSVAVSADNDDSKIDKEKKLLQVTQSDGDLQLKVKDNSWGFRIATMYKVNEHHQFGVLYRSPIHHNYTGKIYLDNLRHGAGSTDYQTFFGGATYETRVSTKFVMPQSFVLGYSFKPSNKWTFNVDVEWLDWSSVKRQNFNWLDETNATRLAVLNTGNPQARDWKSVWSQSIGMEYLATEKVRLRGGYMHHQTPIGKTAWDTTFPDSNSHAFTVGVGVDVTSRFLIDFAYVADLYEVRKINNDVDNVFGASLDGKYKEFIQAGMVTLTYKF